MKQASHGILFLFLGAFAAGICAAGAEGEGKLDAFEKDANSSKAQRQKDNGNWCDSDSSDFWGDLFSSILRYSLVYGGECSLARVSGREYEELDVSPRAPGEPLIPIARLDIDYRNIESDIDAIDVRAEAGFGLVGAQVDFTRYREREPADDMDITRIMGLYRMSFGSHVETDLGFGILMLNGEQTTSRFVFSLPILAHPGKNWGIELRPSWADGISDYDAALMLTLDHASFKVGYRWVNSPNESLNGYR